MTMIVSLPPALRLRARLPIAAAARAAWTRRGDRLIVPGAHDTVIVEATTGGEPATIVERWPYAYTGFACGWDDSYVAAANARGYIDLWRFGQQRPGEPKARHNGAIHAVAFSDDGRRIFTAGDDGRVGIWRAATLDCAFFAVGGRADDLAWNAATDTLAVAAGRSGVVMLDGSSGARQTTLRLAERATAVAWADGLLYAGTRDGLLTVYDGKRLEPARDTAALGVGAIARIVALEHGVVVEGADALAGIDGETGEVAWRWPHGTAIAGGSLAAHAGQSVIAVAVPTGTDIVDVARAEKPVAATQVLALHHPSDEALAAEVVAHLRAGGADVVAIADDSRRFVELARRARTAIVFYGPAGAPLRHDWAVDVLQTRGVRVVPVILPGGAVPEAQRRFHGAAYVCFHARLRDADALARVSRAVLPDLNT
jgi:hypothetical protein